LMVASNKIRASRVSPTNPSQVGCSAVADGIEGIGLPGVGVALMAPDVAYIPVNTG